MFWWIIFGWTFHYSLCMVRRECRLDIGFPGLIIDHIEEWSTENDKMSQVIQGLPGYRLLRQDPLECFYSFLCSSNNNIARIHSMLEKFRREYGIHLPTIKTIKDEIKVEKHQQEEPVFYSFPSVSTLIERCTEADLRKLGFGYRARYIYETTQLLDVRISECVCHRWTHTSE